MEFNKPRFTIGFTYYNEPDILKEQIKLWEDFPSEVEIILVDDGSLVYPAYNYLQNHKIENFRLFVVDEDLGFNSHGCRNLVAKVAKSDFVLFSDIDIFFSPETISILKRKMFKKNKVYRFSMYSVWDKTIIDAPGHENIYLTSKDKFWEAGGYDESFTGYHHGDRPFLEKLKRVTTEELTKNLAYRCVRNKRDTIIVPELKKPYYDNEKMVLYLTEKPLKYSEMEGSVKTKINFSYTQVL